MSVPILPGTCSWRAPAFPCGIPCPAALRASVALLVLPSLPWSRLQACPWARDFYFSPAQGHQSLPLQCRRMPGSSHSSALLGHVPSWSYSADWCLAWAWTCCITRTCQITRAWPASPGLPWFLARGSGMGPVWGSLPCQLWYWTWLQASHPWGSSWPLCTLSYRPPEQSVAMLHCEKVCPAPLLNLPWWIWTYCFIFYSWWAWTASLPFLLCSSVLKIWRQLPCHRWYSIFCGKQHEIAQSCLCGVFHKTLFTLIWKFQPINIFLEI